MNEYQEPYEKEISLTELLFFCLKKWRWVIAAMVVVAVLAGAWKYQSTVQSNQAKREAQLLEEEDGEIKEAFRTTAYLNKENPRCGIGYVAPGHYKFVVVDGRNAGYSKGASMTEFARIMKDEGCVLAYNLDGGHCSFMTMGDSTANHPYQPEKEISDGIFITEGL